MKRLYKNYYSISQINLFNDCPEKWYTAYVQKIKSPPTPATELGTKVHSLIANDGRIIPEYNINATWSKEEDNEILKHALQIYNDTKDITEYYCAEAEKEKEFKIQIGNSIMMGYIDLIKQQGDKITIIDWKTGRYEEKIFQLLTYAWAAWKLTGLTNINVALVYLKAKVEGQKKWSYPYNTKDFSLSFYNVPFKEIQKVDDYLPKIIEKMENYRNREEKDAVFNPHFESYGSVCNFCTKTECSHKLTRKKKTESVNVKFL